jgi:hypothetical protein
VREEVEDYISLRNGNALGLVSIEKTAANDCQNDLRDILRC